MWARGPLRGPPAITAFAASARAAGGTAGRPRVGLRPLAGRGTTETRKTPRNQSRTSPHGHQSASFSFVRKSGVPKKGFAVGLLVVEQLVRCASVAIIVEFFDTQGVHLPLPARGERVGVRGRSADAAESLDRPHPSLNLSPHAGRGNKSPSSSRRGFCARDCLDIGPRPGEARFPPVAGPMTGSATSRGRFCGFTAAPGCRRAHPGTNGKKNGQKRKRAKDAERQQCVPVVRHANECSSPPFSGVARP